jgi:hypothetical protein
MNSPEPMKLTASTRTAYGAVKISIRRPAKSGAADLRGRVADLELRVSLDERATIDQRR